MFSRFNRLETIEITVLYESLWVFEGSFRSLTIVTLLSDWFAMDTVKSASLRFFVIYRFCLKLILRGWIINFTFHFFSKTKGALPNIDKTPIVAGHQPFPNYLYFNINWESCQLDSYAYTSDALRLTFCSLQQNVRGYARFLSPELTPR